MRYSIIRKKSSVRHLMVSWAGSITDAVRFCKFLAGCASLVSEQLNDSTPEVKTILTQMKRGLTNAYYSCSI